MAVGDYKLPIQTTLAILLMWSISVSAIGSPSRFYSFAESDLTNDLSQVDVLKIYQDSLGFIWILTSEGLNRYDGVSNTIFRADVSDSSSLSSDSLRGVAEDSIGNLWFGTQQGGLNKFNRVNQTFEVFNSRFGQSNFLHSDRISTLSEGRDGLIWFGYEEGGITAFHPETMTSQYFSPKRFPVLSSGFITDIVQTSEFEVFIGTLGNGLLK